MKTLHRAMWLPARMIILTVLLAGLTACSTKNLIQTAQAGVDGVAAKYGASGAVADAREGLAEAEAAKIGRVLLPRGYPTDPALIYTDLDGNVYTNGVVVTETFQRRRQLADRSSPVIILAQSPSTPPPAGAATTGISTRVVSVMTPLNND